MKKTISIILSLVMLFSIFSSIDAFVYADEIVYGTCGDNVTYKINNTTGEMVISGTGPMRDYDANYPFENMAPYRNYYKNVKSLIIEDGVTSIGDYAFPKFSNLESISFGKDVESIGECSFTFCSSIKNLTIPNGVKIIKQTAFALCLNLLTISIPESVEEIGDHAFSPCSNLQSITVDENNQNYLSQDGVLFTKDKTELVTFPPGHYLCEYTVPNGVKTINNAAFCDTHLTNIALPNGLETIEQNAFFECDNLKSIAIPDSVTLIGKSAFSVCDSLETIIFLNSNCNIKLSEDEDSPTIPANTKIVGFANSTAEKYAIENNIEFEVFTKCDDYGINHNYDNDIIIKSPTCTETGIRHYECKYCENTKTEIIPLIAHKCNTVTISATTSKDGKRETKCSVCGKVIKTVPIYQIKTINIPASSYTYSGYAKTPAVEIKDRNGNVLKKDRDYTVTYDNTRKSVGRYAIKISLKGNYSGTITKTFDIKPKSTSLSRLTASRGGINVHWKKQPTQTTGYQIQYSTSDKFTSPKTITVSNNSTTSKSISKLTKGKKYYVRIRTYKTVKYGGKNINIYSKWSNYKYVTIKK